MVRSGIRTTASLDAPVEWGSNRPSSTRISLTILNEPPLVRPQDTFDPCVKRKINGSKSVQCTSDAAISHSSWSSLSTVNEELGVKNCNGVEAALPQSTAGVSNVSKLLSVKYWLDCQPDVMIEAYLVVNVCHTYGKNLIDREDKRLI